MQINESTSRVLINGLSGFKIVEKSLRCRTRCDGFVSSSSVLRKIMCLRWCSEKKIESGFGIILHFYTGPIKYEHVLFALIRINYIFYGRGKNGNVDICF